MSVLHIEGCELGDGLRCRCPCHLPVGHPLRTATAEEGQVENLARLLDQEHERASLDPDEWVDVEHADPCEVCGVLEKLGYGRSKRGTNG